MEHPRSFIAFRSKSRSREERPEKFWRKSRSRAGHSKNYVACSFKVPLPCGASSKFGRFFILLYIDILICMHTYMYKLYIHTCIHSSYTRTHIRTYVHTYIHKHFIHTYSHTYFSYKHSYVHAYILTLHDITLHYITVQYITLHQLRSSPAQSLQKLPNGPVETCQRGPPTMDKSQLRPWFTPGSKAAPETCPKPPKAPK